MESHSAGTCTAPSALFVPEVGVLVVLEPSQCGSGLMPCLCCLAIWPRRSAAHSCAIQQLNLAKSFTYVDVDLWIETQDISFCECNLYDSALPLQSCAITTSPAEPLWSLHWLRLTQTEAPARLSQAENPLASWLLQRVAVGAFKAVRLTSFCIQHSWGCIWGWGGAMTT